MGVIIYTCKLKERVSDLCSDEEYNALLEKYDEIGEDILCLENGDKFNDLISPFESGVYTFESGYADVQMSYGGNGDFRQCLENIGEENDNADAFLITLSASGIDNCISYVVAKEMLEEFEKYYEQSKTYFHRYGSDDYGEFLWGVYQQYIKVLKECVELNGVVRYH